MVEDWIYQQEKDENDTALLDVAVITPSFKDFQNYILENAIKNERYHWIFSLKEVQGKKFNRIQGLYNYFSLDDINDVLEYLETHLRSNRK